MSQSAAIFDLDRTLISGSSAPVFARHMGEAGIADVPDIPLADFFMKFYEMVGERRLLMQPAKIAHRASKGWSVDAVRAAAEVASHEIVANLQPFASSVIDDHRENGRLLVLATTSPEAFVGPLAELLGFDDVVATKWTSRDGFYAGELDGPFVWGKAKADAIGEWAQANKVSLSKSYAYSDSYYDAPMLEAVGNPVAVNPDAQLSATALLKGWPIRHLDKSDGVMKVAGREIQEWGRPFMKPSLVAPYADIDLIDAEKIPSDGPCIIVFNHRSYFDPTVMGLIIAKAGRNVRGLGKKEVFDLPIVGRLMRAIGGVRVERASGSDEPLEQAAEVLAGGEVVMMAPQGTSPRGPAFFDPDIKGRWGAARLAALSRVPVIPVGLWGTEKVWPRSARLPNMIGAERPKVTARVGDPVHLTYRSPGADTDRIMAALVELLPPEAREHHDPTPEELARTYPPGYKGDPQGEGDRRPGTDT
jgi:putative phosphoserine phosphatase/1-acylglycerol-3-phosphate O-acyltransferase